MVLNGVGVYVWECLWVIVKVMSNNIMGKKLAGGYESQQ